jgi:hypothetical protein
VKTIVRSLAAASLAPLLASMLACGASVSAAPPAESSGASTAETSARDAEATRQDTLAAVARIDRRLARRMGHRPEGVDLLFAENRAPAELAALFDFDARAKALARERWHVERVRTRAREESASLSALVRLLDEERARVEDERDLPRGASAIVRTLAIDLPVTATREEDLHSEDDGLVESLDRVRATVRDGALGSMQLAELDDSLDLFEKRTERLPRTPGAIARLRVALTSVKAAPSEAIAPWETTEPRVAVFTGPLPEAAAFDRTLREAHAALRARVEAVTPKGSSDRERLYSAAAAMLLSTAPDADCAEAGLPEVQAPIERRGLCIMLRALSKDDPVGLLAAELALDVARWSLAIHRGRADVASVFVSRQPALPLDEVDGAHSFRFAMAHPVEAITLGWAAALVARNPQKMAAAWIAHGALRPVEARAMFGAALM